ncbi:hypothetical protein ACFYO0_45115 [Streptomyces sp. NPDC006365]|uniref:hypothetical protein n=1 Tax=Streptomyces sp. NPDC006365 TaxID=3364744 RepID=UPI0036739C24
MTAIMGERDFGTTTAEEQRRTAWRQPLPTRQSVSSPRIPSGQVTRAKLVTGQDGSGIVNTSSAPLYYVPWSPEEPGWSIEQAGIRGADWLMGQPGQKLVLVSQKQNYVRCAS